MKKVYYLLFASIISLSFFSCEPENTTPPPVTVTDIDGNVYQTIIIGTQTWMVENLKVSKYRNGDPIPNVIDATEWAGYAGGIYPDTGAYCYYNNDPTNGTIYGKLYNWQAVNDSRKIAPSGWHVPTEAECTTLFNYLGGASIAGGKMKKTGTSNWISPNTDADNSSGFAGLPGGCRYGSDPFPFYGISGIGYWWTATGPINDPRCFRLFYNYGVTGIESGYGKYFGFSVRCVKD